MRSSRAGSVCKMPMRRLGFLKFLLAVVLIVVLILWLGLS